MMCKEALLIIHFSEIIAYNNKTLYVANANNKELFNILSKDIVQEKYEN